MTLDQRYIMMIDNAYYAVNPPVTEQRSQGRKLTPLASYVEKLIFNDLSSHNTEKVLKQIRRLHWNDPEEAAFIVKTLGDVWNYKFNNIRYVFFFFLKNKKFCQNARRRVELQVQQHQVCINSESPEGVKIWRGGSNNVVGVTCPPGWNRVN